LDCKSPFETSQSYFGGEVLHTGQNTNTLSNCLKRKGFQAREIDQKSKGPSFRKVANVFNAQQKVNINIG
jgi:hypothetical protein